MEGKVVCGVEGVFKYVGLDWGRGFREGDELRQSRRVG